MSDHPITESTMPKDSSCINILTCENYIRRVLGEVPYEQFFTGINGSEDFLFMNLDTGEIVTESFTYTMSDGQGGSDTATVTITLTGSNDPITAVDDSGVGFITDKNTPFNTASVLANDIDPEDGLSITGFNTTGTFGIVIWNRDDTFGYDPNGQFEHLAAGESATDSFIYYITDGEYNSSATVTITITGVDEGFFIYMPIILFGNTP